MEALFYKILELISASIIAGVSTWFIATRKTHREQKKAQYMLLEILIRLRLLEAHKIYIENKTPMPVEIKKELADMNEAYTVLHMNGIGKEMLHDLLEVKVRL